MEWCCEAHKSASKTQIFETETELRFRKFQFRKMRRRNGLALSSSIGFLGRIMMMEVNKAKKGLNNLVLGMC